MLVRFGWRLHRWGREMEDSGGVSLSILELGKEGLEAWLAERGEKPYRARQILEWLFEKRVQGFDEMSNLGQELRAELERSFHIRPLETLETSGAEDATRKYLFRLRDGQLIESVFIQASPGSYGEQSDRRTICISSQVGCAYDCRFCASGLAGFARNLTTAEIVAQVLQVEEKAGERVNNVVFMGMGEPLANLKNLSEAIKILNAHWGVGIGGRHITVSTSGLAPQIEKLADDTEAQIRLAVSLHGASDEVRERIMPVNLKYPLDRLFEALHYWLQRRKQRITFEYILIKGVNDDLDQARLLAKRARSVSALVNLIPYNTVEGMPWERPAEEHQEAFLRAVKSGDVAATLRREKGGDINAACGQLRLRREGEVKS